jgi:hypothetical protein
VVDANGTARVAVPRTSFGEKEREVVTFDGLSASSFRYDTGVEAIRISNRRGNVVVLPYLGQMVWAAAFDGVDLAMMGWMAPSRHRCAKVGLSKTNLNGAIHERG